MRHEAKPGPPRFDIWQCYERPDVYHVVYAFIAYEYSKPIAVKIGASTNVLARFNRIQSECSLELHPWAHISCARKDCRFTGQTREKCDSEVSLHNLFDQWRLGKTEWFRYSDEIGDLLYTLMALPIESIKTRCRCGKTFSDEFGLDQHLRRMREKMDRKYREYRDWLETP